MKKMIGFLRRALSNLPLRSKFTYILAVGLFMIAAVSLLSITILLRTSNALLYNSVAGSLSYSSTAIDAQLQNVEYLSEVLLSNKSIQAKFAQAKDSGADNGKNYAISTQSLLESYHLLVNYSNSYQSSNVRYINLYSHSYEVRSDSTPSTKAAGEVYDAVKQRARSAGGKPVWVYDYSREDGLFLGRSIRRMKLLELDDIGTIVICVDLNKMIEGATGFFEQYKHSSYVVLDKGSLVYSTDEFSEEDMEKLSGVAPQSYTILKLAGDNYFAVRDIIDYNGWDCFNLVPYDSLVKNLNATRLLLVVLLILALLIIISISRRLIASVVRHLDVLIVKMDTFSVDEKQLPDAGYDYSVRRDEIGRLHQRFGHMAERIQQLVQVNYLNEILNKETQLKALKMQMNPHFLYNTLTSIHCRAQASGDPDIARMVQSLSTLLRTTLSNQSNTVTIAQELEHINAYMTIQKIRFEERLQFSVQADEGLSRMTIPPLSIQPLIENAIHYGLEEITEACQIQLSIREADGFLHIRVRNEGSVFDEDILEKLENNSVTPNGFGIGLLNIDKRLKLMFGEEHGLRLSNEDGWACAEIVIPARK